MVISKGLEIDLKRGEEGTYKTCRVEGLTCILSGIFVYKRSKTVLDGMKQLLRDYKRESIDFNRMWGCYRLIIEDKPAERIIFFGDNMNANTFFIDKENNSISDRFLTLLTKREKLEKDLNAVAHFLKFGLIYGTRTLVKGISKTDPDYYYILEGERIKKKAKKLLPFEKLKNFGSLHELMKRIVTVAAGENISAVITGGTDSRAVLAHLISLGISPSLTIGKLNNDREVEIAAEIAEIVNLKLNVSASVPKGDGWIYKAFKLSDGLMPLFTRYGHMENIEMNSKLGSTLQFGGGAGELYKNSFINQEYPFYNSKRINLDRLYKFKIPTLEYPAGILSEELNREMSSLENEVKGKLSDLLVPGRSKVQNYNGIGYDVMRYRTVITSCNIHSGFLSVSHPLMERDAAALVFSENPWKLEMQSFPRNEIAKYCPQIQNVKTDRGLTCNASAGAKRKEFLKSLLFLFKVWLKRAAKLGSCEPIVPAYFELGMKSPEYQRAIEVCAEIGVLNKSTGSQFSIGMADRLATVGMVFDKTLNRE